MRVTHVSEEENYLTFRWKDKPPDWSWGPGTDAVEERELIEHITCMFMYKSFYTYSVM